MTLLIWYTLTYYHPSLCPPGSIYVYWCQTMTSVLTFCSLTLEVATQNMYSSLILLNARLIMTSFELRLAQAVAGQLFTLKTGMVKRA